MELNVYVYNKDRSADSKVYWRCEDRTCKDRVVVKVNYPVKTTQVFQSLFLVEI